MRGENFEVDSVLDRGSSAGPDIIANKNESRIIVEVKNPAPMDAKYRISTGIGQLLYRMEEYGAKNTDFYLGVKRSISHFVPEIMYTVGIGLMIVELEGSVIKIDRVSPPPGVLRRKYRRRDENKDEVIQIRCHLDTKRKFNIYVAENYHSSKEDALKSMLNRAYPKSEVRYP